MSEAENCKKVFFLYPQSVIQDQLISSLLKNEYEVYFLKDHRKAAGIFKRFNNSICFINIDDGLKEKEWEDYIKNLRSDPEIVGLQLGILSYNNDPDLMQKYLMDIGVECGFVQLKLGVKQSKEIILKVLEANEAKGRRKYIRVNCENDDQITMNFDYKEKSYNGQIIDISSVGLACQFYDTIPIDNKSALSKIQLNLKGSLVQTDGIVLGRRSDNENILILLFNPRLKENELSKVQNFLHKALQKKMDKF